MCWVFAQQVTYTIKLHAIFERKTAAWREDAFKEFSPTFWIRPATLLRSVHEIVVPIFQSSQRSGWLCINIPIYWLIFCFQYPWLGMCIRRWNLALPGSAHTKRYTVQGFPKWRGWRRHVDAESVHQCFKGPLEQSLLCTPPPPHSSIIK